MNKKIFIIGIITLIIDQLVKILVEMNFVLNESRIIIKNFFMITSVHNSGAAWNLLNNQVPLLILVSLIALFLIIYLMADFKVNYRNTLAFGILLGGIIGNLLDRIFLGYVRDFLAFDIWGYNFPVFNISDMAIFLGGALLIYAIIKGEDHGNKSRRHG